tara:strand:+ start:346 stop:483 length:138 start_codon:yes stop_codon:yes gene_type:complete
VVDAQRWANEAHDIDASGGGAAVPFGYINDVLKTFRALTSAGVEV